MVAFYFGLEKNSYLYINVWILFGSLAFMKQNCSWLSNIISFLFCFYFFFFLFIILVFAYN